MRTGESVHARDLRKEQQTVIKNVLKIVHPDVLGGLSLSQNERALFEDLTRLANQLAEVLKDGSIRADSKWGSGAAPESVLFALPSAPNQRVRIHFNTHNDPLTIFEALQQFAKDPAAFIARVKEFKEQPNNERQKDVEMREHVAACAALLAREYGMALLTASQIHLQERSHRNAKMKLILSITSVLSSIGPHEALEGKALLIDDVHTGVAVSKKTLRLHYAMSRDQIESVLRRPIKDLERQVQEEQMRAEASRNYTEDYARTFKEEQSRAQEVEAAREKLQSLPHFEVASYAVHNLTRADIDHLAHALEEGMKMSAYAWLYESRVLVPKKVRVYITPKSVPAIGALRSSNGEVTLTILPTASAEEIAHYLTKAALKIEGNATVERLAPVKVRHLERRLRSTFGITFEPAFFDFVADHPSSALEFIDELIGALRKVNPARVRGIHIAKPWRDEGVVAWVQERFRRPAFVRHRVLYADRRATAEDILAAL